MSEVQSSSSSSAHFWSQFSFIRLFGSFRQAFFPFGKPVLALLMIFCLGVDFWILDAVSRIGSGGRVVQTVTVGTDEPVNELDVYVRSGMDKEETDRFRRQTQNLQKDRLQSLVSQLTIDMQDHPIDSGFVHEQIESAYKEHCKQAWRILANHYELRERKIEDDFSEKSAQPDAAKKLLKADRDKKIDQVKQDYATLFHAVYMEGADRSGVTAALGRFVVADETAEDVNAARERARADETNIRDAIRLGEANELDHALQGRGLCAALIEFYGKRMHAAAVGVLHLDFGEVIDPLLEAAMGKVWLLRYHPIMGLLFFVLALISWAFFGGAICRMTALKLGPDEHIGPVPALKFAVNRFVSLITALGIPLLIIIGLGAVIAVGGFVGNLWALDILVGLLMFLALAAGAVIAAIAILYIAAGHLLIPSAATEGTGGWDAMSRCYAYIFRRPWHVVLYGAVSFLFGAVCYLFVRLFAWILLSATHFCIGITMNWAELGHYELNDKLDGLWPAPTFFDLIPNIPWNALNWHETMAAFLICGWVCLVTGLLCAWVICYYFTACTTIYFLLRKAVDGRADDDIYLEERIEDIVDSSEEKCLKEDSPALRPATAEAPEDSQAEAPDQQEQSPSDGADESEDTEKT